MWQVCVPRPRAAKRLESPHKGRAQRLCDLKSLLGGTLGGNIYRQMLSLLLPEAVAKSGAWEKLGSGMSTRALRSSDSPGSLEGHVHAQGCADTQERPGNDLNNRLWLTFRLRASRKGRRRKSCQMSG